MYSEELVVGEETLAENRRVRAEAATLRARTKVLLLDYRRHRFFHVSGGSDAAASRHILIVDDDLRILQLLGDGLKHDYLVEMATSGAEALAAIQRQRPDLVLLDVILPGMSGIHLLKQIKQRDPSIAIVILTGSGNALLEAQAMDNGAAGFVRKPFDMKYLERLVAQIVGES